MQSPDSQIIVKRFFLALEQLKNDGVIRGVKTFTDRYGINRWNLSTLAKDTARDIFQPAWLTYLVNDYKISPLWLLTGSGNIYMNGWTFADVREFVKNHSKRAKDVQAKSEGLQ